MKSIDRDMDEVLGPLTDVVAALPPERPRLALVEPEVVKTPQQIEFDRCRPWLEAAMGGGRHTMDDVVRALADGSAQLWPGKASAMVTEVHQFPTGKALQVWLAGGDADEMLAMQAGVEAWARLVGCTEVIIEGRQGWARKLKALGFELYCVSLRKAL